VFRKGGTEPVERPVNARRKSAEGVVVQRQARLGRHSPRKGEQRIGRSRNAGDKGPNGRRSEGAAKSERTK